MKSALQLYSTTREYCGHELSCKHLLTTSYLTAEIYYSQKNLINLCTKVQFFLYCAPAGLPGELNRYHCLPEAQGQEVELFFAAPAV